MVTPFVEDFFIYPRMLDLSACLTEQIEARGLPPACWNGIMSGATPAYDPCSCGGGSNGQAYVNLLTGFPSTNFPNPVNTPNCIPDLAFQLEVGVLRCYPTNSDGTPLDVAQELEAVRLQMADMAATLAAIRCCMGNADADDDMQYLVGQYTPYGPQGGVVGGVWTVYVTQGTKPLEV